MACFGVPFSYGVSLVLASISPGAFVLVRPVGEEDPNLMDLGVYIRN